jgi:hypothetical protein
MQVSKPLNRKYAIALALVGMWLLSCIAVFVLVHSYDWEFFDLHGHDATTVEQIGAFYLAWTGAQLTAAGFAGMIIGSSDFAHPMRITFWTTAAYFLAFSSIRALHWPWQSLHNLDQVVPILAYLISMLSLIGFSVFAAWFMPKFYIYFQKHFAH